MSRQDSHRSEKSVALNVVAGGEGVAPQRPWLGVWFECAGAYQRVVRSADGTHYQARCPQCGRNVTFRVGAEGTNQRFFKVRC